MRVIAIDIGSSFLKASVLDIEQGTILKKYKRPAPERIGEDRRFEVNAVEYVLFVRELVDECIRLYDTIQGIVLATQMHGYVYSPLPDVGNDVYVSWQDMRCLDERQDGQTYMAYLQQQFSHKRMQCCGVYIKPSMGCCNLYTTLAQNLQMPRNGRLYTIGSYIIYSLTGKNVCHPSNAAPLGLLNAKDLCWDQSLIRDLGFDEIEFPELTLQSYKACGVYQTNGQSIPVFPDYGDQQVSILGCMPQTGDGIVNIATGAQVVLVTDHFNPGDYEMRPYFEGKYLMTISNMPAGRNLDVLINFFSETAWRLTGQKLSNAETWYQINRDFQLGLRNMRVDINFYPTPQKLDGGTITGITHHNLHVDTILSAAFEDMAQTYYDNFKILAHNCPLNAIICAGGVSWRTPMLVRAIRERMGIPCKLSPIEDEVLAGLYRIALCCMGAIGSIDENPHRVLRN